MSISDIFLRLFRSGRLLRSAGSNLENEVGRRTMGIRGAIGKDGKWTDYSAPAKDSSSMSPDATAAKRPESGEVVPIRRPVKPEAGEGHGNVPKDATDSRSNPGHGLLSAESAAPTSMRKFTRYSLQADSERRRVTFSRHRGLEVRIADLKREDKLYLDKSGVLCRRESLGEKRKDLLRIGDVEEDPVLGEYVINPIDARGRAYLMVVAELLDLGPIVDGYVRFPHGAFGEIQVVEASYLRPVSYEALEGLTNTPRIVNELGIWERYCIDGAIVLDKVLGGTALVRVMQTLDGDMSPLKYRVQLEQLSAPRAAGVSSIIRAAGENYKLAPNVSVALSGVHSREVLALLQDEGLARSMGVNALDDVTALKIVQGIESAQARYLGPISG